MKKIIVLSQLVLVFMMATTSVFADKEVSITEAELPANCKAFLTKHFNGIAITYIEKETDWFKLNYTVYLANRFEVEFNNKNCEWDEIEGHHNPLPQSFIDILPAGIMQYINANYSGRKMVKANKENDGYEIEIEGNIELEFDKNGKFLKID